MESTAPAQRPKSRAARNNWSCALSEDALDVAEDDDVGVDGQRLRLALA